MRRSWTRLFGGGLGLAVAAASAALALDSSVAQGKALFVERCAKCHDQDASRALPDGRSLVERLRGKPDLAAALAGRLKDLPDDKRQAVVAYVAGLLQKAPPKSR